MLICSVVIERWPLTHPFGTAREVIEDVPMIVVKLTDRHGRVGRGEALGVDYDGETPASMREQVLGARAQFDDDLNGERLAVLLSLGGARNAVDCALWDLRAKQTGIPVWKAIGLAPLKPVPTVYTIGLADPETTRQKIREARRYPMLKLKLDSTRHLDVIRMAREQHPEARLIVDANEAWTRPELETLLPGMVAAGIELIEQPLRRGTDMALDGFTSPIPLAADESCTNRASLKALRGRYQYVNIKLDKTGGLTEALAVAAEATRMGFGLMVGNMGGTSLAMAPAFLIGQSCRYADLDGALLLAKDREHPMLFEDGALLPPSPLLWG